MDPKEESQSGSGVGEAFWDRPTKRYRQPPLRLASSHSSTTARNLFWPEATMDCINAVALSSAVQAPIKHPPS